MCSLNNKLNMEKFVHNGTIDNSNMPLDIEERRMA